MKSGDMCIFIFYFVLNFFAIATIYNFSHNYFSRFSLFFHFVLFSTVIISSYLLLIIRNSPGFVKKYDELTNISTQNNNNEAANISIQAENDKNEFQECSRCGICVRKFDHHCFLVGGCIGEENHFKFYIYLITQSIALLFAIYAILDSTSYVLEKTGENYSKVPVILYPLFMILSCYCLLTVS
jgi:hypothetical protein